MVKMYGLVLCVCKTKSYTFNHAIDADSNITQPDTDQSESSSNDPGADQPVIANTSNTI
jgi:hypothetical protein